MSADAFIQARLRDNGYEVPLNEVRQAILNWEAFVSPHPGLHSSSFILDARQALREADAALGKGHVASLHGRNLKARMADLLTHATYLEGQVELLMRLHDDSEADLYGGFRPGMVVRLRSNHSQRGVVYDVSRTLRADQEEYVTATVRFEDGEMVNHLALSIEPVPTDPEPAEPVALAYDQEAVAEQILAFFDRARGTCPCQSYPGEKHDVTPPCTRRREANLLAIELRPVVTRG